MKQRGRRGLSVLLTLCLLAGLSAGLAVPAAAADHWAQSAVTTLNEIYGENTFSTDETAPMKEKDAAGILKAMGCVVTELGESSETTLNRSKACEALAEAFALPLNGKQAIDYLYEQKIINGKSPDNLAGQDPVTNAEFAVLTYRVLNAVGGGMGSDIEGLKPGTDEYYAWLYLAVRKCVPFEQSDKDTTKIGSAAISTYDSSSLKEGYTDIYDVVVTEKSGEAIWNAWEDALQDTNIGGLGTFSATNYSGEDTLLAAATKMVTQFMEAKYSGQRVIFHDVRVTDWCYDGIMYLADRQIVIGYGDGQFGANDQVTHQDLAVMLYRYKDQTTAPGQKELDEAKTYVTEEGYMAPGGEDWWVQSATRGETVTAIIKACADSDDLAQVNTQVLGRFSDAKDLSSDSDTAKCAAYAVSIGILNGNADGTLGLDNDATRGEAGVLFYRTLIGVDKTKMHDYEQSVTNVLGSGDGGDSQQGGGLAEG